MAPVTVVISQSMYFPWVGLLEQIRMADIFVHYDDVQFARGFLNRVQIKSENGLRWMTVPTRDRHRGQTIDEVLIDDRKPWRDDHRNQIKLALKGAPYVDDALGLMDEVFNLPAVTLADVSRASVKALARYFELDTATQFLKSREMDRPGKSSQRLRDLTQAAGGQVYLTGHGAKNYLDHELFETAGLEVRYMQYACSAYPQLHGEFTPYVTGLDLVANLGKSGKEQICSSSVNWKEIINGSD